MNEQNKQPEPGSVEALTLTESDLASEPLNATAETPASDLVDKETPYHSGRVETLEIPKETETITADVLVENSALPQPAPGKVNRKAGDYAGLDWRKSNVELAKEVGVTPQYIRILRKKHDEGTLTEQPAIDKPQTELVETAPAQVVATNYEIMAATVFDMSVGTLTMVFGPEWQPRNPEEKGAVVMTLKAYMESKQMKDLPPGVILAFVCMAYAAPRFTAPATSTKLKVGWSWFKEKCKKFLPRKKFAPVVMATPAESPKETK